MHAATLAHHSTTPDTPLGDLPNSGRVLLPAELLAADLSATALAVWVLLAEHVRPGRPEAWPTRDTLMRRLGRAGADGCTVSRAVAQLEAAGWLEVARIHRNGKTQNVYRPRRLVTDDDDRRWVEITERHRAALHVGAISPQQLRSLARWLYAAGRAGWTRDTLARHAADYGTSTATAKRDRAALVAAGLLETRTDPGRPTITAAPGRLPAARSDASQPPPQTGGRIATSPGAEVPRHRGQNRHTEVTPVEVTPDEATACGPARRARTVPNARAAATATPPASKPEKKDHDDKPEPSAEQTEQQRTAGHVLAAFPAAYRQQPRWVRAQVLELVSAALAAGYGPAALVSAAHRHDRPERNACHTLRRSLTELASDVLAGACPACGHDPDGPRPICDACNPDRDTLTAAELDALAAAGWLTTQDEDPRP